MTVKQSPAIFTILQTNKNSVFQVLPKPLVLFPKQVHNVFARSIPMAFVWQ